MFHKISLFFLLLVPISCFAKHLRSGEITYKPVTGVPNTYEITVTVYTNVGPATPDIPNLISGTTTFSFGDNTSAASIPRSNGIGELLSSTIRKNVYTVIHTYPGNGTYIISFSAANRNSGILNIPSSDATDMYVASMLTISDKYPPFTSPLPSFPPLGDGCTYHTWTNNPGAIDTDGDILKYRLIKCKTSGGVDIPGYKFPEQLDPTGLSTFTVDSLKGTIKWDSPTSLQGDYNLAMKIEKWRNGTLIGYVIRDWQVIIEACDNTPPNIKPVKDICVVAGKPITYQVSSSVTNNDSLIFTSTGMPYMFLNSPADFSITANNKGSSIGLFNWNTNPTHIRKNPFAVYYNVVDKETGLSFPVTNWITILASPVQNVNISIFQRGFNVKWEQSIYPQATGYNVYRKTGNSPFTTDSCTTGVPLNSGYLLVGTVNNPTTLSYIDSNKGKGLTSGYSYCYIVTAVFADGAESAPSTPYCAPLPIHFITIVQDTLSQCVGNNLNIDSTIIRFENTDQNTKYKWTTTPALQLTNADKQVPGVKMNTLGIHPVKIVSSSGVYTDSATIYFNVLPIPVPVIKKVDLGGIPDSVMFYNRSNYAVSAEWSLPDGTKSSNPDSVIFAFNKNGYYRIYLKVYNSLGCPDTTSILYRVTMKGLSIPNAFEPENPNLLINNFKPKALGLKSFFMAIWDLWGNLLWSTDKVNNVQEPSEGWNGNDSKGRKMPSQNYIWRMNATFIDGTAWKGVKDHFGNFHKEGTFTLLR